jgi:uncharacterized protein DUF695
MGADSGGRLVARMNFLERLFSRKPKREPAWFIADLINREKKIGAVVRYLDGRPEGLRHLTTAMHITWLYGEEGLPTAEENAAMNAFEERLDPLTEDPQMAQMVWVRMAFGKKEWLVYTSDEVQFMREFHRLLADNLPEKVVVTAERDPKWRRWSEFVKPLMKRAAKQS